MTGFLLDTNVVSETLGPEPDQNVLAFLTSAQTSFLSVVTVHELSYGLERLQPGTKRRHKLSTAIEKLLSTYQDEIIPVSPTEARTAGIMRAAAQAAGRTVHMADALIAATAIVHGLTVATRNTRDFDGLGVGLQNPWSVNRDA